MPSSPPDAREARERRLTRTGVAWRVGALAAGTALALYGGLFGTGIAALFTGWNAYGPRQGGVSDAAIDAEVKKMKE